MCISVLHLNNRRTLLKQQIICQRIYVTIKIKCLFHSARETELFNSNALFPLGDSYICMSSSSLKCSHLKSLIYFPVAYNFVRFTAQKMKFSFKDFFRKCDQIRSFMWIWSHLLKKSLMGDFIFCAVFTN